MGEITVEGLKQKMDQNEDFILIDVREPYEYEEFNLGGRLIPLGEFMDRIPEMEDFKTKEIIINCRSGKRSAMATEVLTNAGFPDVKNLVGGVLRWQEVYPA